MSSKYHFELITGETPLSDVQQETLQASLRYLCSQCLPEIPNYQALKEPRGTDWLVDKMVVLAYLDNNLVGFISALSIPIPDSDDPIIHTGLTMVHPSHRRSTGLKQMMFNHLILHLLGKFPGGFWVTTLAEVISSLVHTSIYTINGFPSIEHNEPNQTHLRIAKEIEQSGSNDWPEGRVFMKDIDDQRYWHRDLERSKFYYDRLRNNKGAEQLLVAFVDPNIIRMAMKKKHNKDLVGKFSSLGVSEPSKL
ncbi:Receptor-like kinase TMK3 [Fusarium sp. NRRL 25303]|nr:Receptor-like kinase TMK3 [Fusarium sp. NRRL 25303]